MLGEGRKTRREEGQTDGRKPVKTKEKLKRKMNKILEETKLWRIKVK